MSQTLTISDRLYEVLDAEAKEQGLESIERLLEVKHTPSTSLSSTPLSEEELRQRREAVRRADELRERIFAKYGQMLDSTELLREDRAR